MKASQKQEVYRHWLASLLDERAKVFDRVRRGMERHGLAVKRVHKLRVASRRMRNALRLAQLWGGRGKFRKLSRALGRFAAGFGALRDLDVQMAFLDRVAARAAPDLAPAFRRLRRHFLKQRRRLAEALDGEPARGRRLAARIRKLAGALEKAGAEGGGPGPERLADSALELQAACQQAADAALANPEDAALHGWRVAVKKLRYRLEALSSMPGQAVPDGVTIGQLTELQDALGEAHDAAVFREAFRTAAAELRRRAREKGCGVRMLAACTRRTLAANGVRKRRAIRRALRMHEGDAGGGCGGVII